MSSGPLTEQVIEDLATDTFRRMGIYTKAGADLHRSGLSTSATFLPHLLNDALAELNPHIPHEARERVIRAVQRPPHPTYIENNRWFHGLLTDGVEVEVKDPDTGENRNRRAALIDFEHPKRNDFLLVRQLTIATQGRPIRPDLVLFVNGLPLFVIELKDPTNAAATLDGAIDQLAGYRDRLPELFVPNVGLAVSDGLLTRVGSVTAGPQRFMPWRSERASEGQPTLNALINDLFDPAALLDYLRNCVVFEEDEYGRIVKKIAGYHQFRAMRKTRASVLSALQDDSAGGDGRGGVVWHTQGSGKSLTMLMLAGALIREPGMANPTVVVVTDRNDLDGQLFKTFAAGRALLVQEPVQADSRAHLGELLDRATGGVIFTTIQKFADSHEKVSERANIVVMTDEAHRSQYGFIDGGARRMREALPGATFVGFTGTPVSRADRNTRHVFGNYADVYGVRQSVADKATVPIYYEPRIIKLTVDEAGAAEVEKRIGEVAQTDEGETAETDIKVSLADLVGAPDRIKELAGFIVEHWDKRRGAMEGKAFVVTMTRDIAARLYDEIVALRPDWHSDRDDAGCVKVVMTGSQGDPEHIRRHVRTKAQRDELAKRFKRADEDFRLVIVVDMWLTGFDVPSAHTMYLDKPLAGHNLMQAIARVNRVHGEKPGGLIVDTINLTNALADALEVYASAAGQDEQPVRQVQDEAIPAMQTAFATLRDFFHGFDYTPALDADPQAVVMTYMNAVDFVLGQQGTDRNGNPDQENPGWKRYRNLVRKLATAFALAVPREETEPIAPHLAFFQRLVAAIRKRLTDEASPTPGGQADVTAAVRQVLGGAVDAGGVIDLFAAAGLDDAKLDILSEAFLGRVAALEQKNLALETLRKLLADQIKSVERRNLVQSRRFREALEQAMLSYTNKQITVVEMIVRLKDLGDWMREERARGRETDASQEEIAFYDALASNGSAKEVMKSDDLRLMARKLTEMVRGLPKLDWTERESVRADLRSQVRRLLARYGYPPDLSEDATQLVLRQAELSTDEDEA